LAEKIGFAIVGVASHHSEFIARAVKNIEEASLVGVYDQDLVKSRKFAEKFSTNYYDSLDQLLSMSEVNVGVVTSENSRKKDLAISVARAKKHVICDKPLGLTALDSREIIKACKESNVKLQVGFVSRYTSEAQFAKRLVSSGKIGSIKYINAENRVDMGLVKMLSPWLLERELAGGGALLEHSVHVIDLALWFSDSNRPLSAYVVSAPNLDPTCEGEDNFSIMISFSNGAITTVDGSYCRASSGRSGDVVMRIIGDKNELEFSSSNFELREYLGEEPSICTKFYSRDISASNEANSGELMVRDMLNSLKSGKDPLASGTAGERVNEVVDASYRSLRSGREERVLMKN
jgi:UDP-N-acetylglucosamine 3-dehydrogenase